MFTIREFDEAHFASGHFRHVFRPEVIDNLVERMFRQLQSRQSVEQFLFQSERGFRVNLLAVFAQQRLVYRFFRYLISYFLV